MRFVLIDWLIEVHESFELCDQTLHLALKYLNIFSSKYEIGKQEYQLVGITCLWIASKYE
jgi:cyclin B